MRWVEEFELIEEDFRRLIRGLEKMAQVFTHLSKVPPPLYEPTNHASLARSTDPWGVPDQPVERRRVTSDAVVLLINDTMVSLEISNGYSAYAHQVADMYTQMADQARKFFVKGGGEWPAAGESLTAMLRRRRPKISVDWAEEERASVLVQ